MKLATLRDGSRDGLLAVVSHDLSLAHVASGRARTLQQVLDDWNFLSPQLEELSVTLNHGKARHAFSFDPRRCMSPLPRAFGWVRATAVGTDHPLRYGSGQAFWGPTDDAFFGWPPEPEAAGSPEPADAAAEAALPTAQVHAGLAVLTGDIASGASTSAALEGVRLLLLAAHWTEEGTQGESAAMDRTAFAPLAVTPDELGAAWHHGRVHAALHLQGPPGNVRTLSADTAQQWQALGFGPLLARLAATGAVPSGSLVGSGALGDPLTGLRPGHSLRLECTGGDGMPVFGVLQQHVAAAG
jgi:fumarylacetoacetate (FAA) hydrolase